MLTTPATLAKENGVVKWRGHVYIREQPRAVHFGTLNGGGWNRPHPVFIFKRQAQNNNEKSIFALLMPFDILRICLACLTPVSYIEDSLMLTRTIYVMC